MCHAKNKAANRSSQTTANNHVGRTTLSTTMGNAEPTPESMHRDSCTRYHCTVHHKLFFFQNRTVTERKVYLSWHPLLKYYSYMRRENYHPLEAEDKNPRRSLLPIRTQLTHPKHRQMFCEVLCAILVLLHTLTHTILNKLTQQCIYSLCYRHIFNLNINSRRLLPKEFKNIKVSGSILIVFFQGTKYFYHLHHTLVPATLKY